MRNFTILVALAFTLIGCPCPDPASPNPQPVPDSDMCPLMCAHLKTLGCEEGQAVYDSDKPGPKDVPNKTCEDFCVEQQSNGIFVNPRCVAKVKTCDEIEAARKNTCQ
jgi:hypothetical protein